MDDPGISWPFWKFGLKRDDLFTTLQDQYNTFPSSIQDPEAFHHDVFELSHAATTPAEFHSLMSERKQHRLRELDESLESASFEIIANPALIGTDQWQLAVQLFRTRSLDSLVRYFASYLPQDHKWHRSDESASSSDSEGFDTDSMTHSQMDDYPGDFPDDFLHDQPADSHHDMHSSPSDGMCSGSSQNDHDHGFPLTPARTMSFSSELDHDQFTRDSCPSLHDDASSHNASDEEVSSASTISSVSDLSETHQKEFLAEQEVTIVDYEDEYPTTQTHNDATFDDTTSSETPTPKPKPEAVPTHLSGGGASFFPEPKPSRCSLSLRSSSMPRLRHCDSSARTHLSLHAAEAELSHLTSTTPADRHHSKHHLKHAIVPSRLRRRDLSPVGKGRSPRGTASSGNGNGSSSRVQKSSAEPLRSKPRGRRREVC